MTPIEQATRIIDLIHHEVTTLPTLAGGSDAGHLAAAGYRAREIAPWLQLGTALALTPAEMTGQVPMLEVETDGQAGEILAVVRAHLAALRAQAEHVIALDETDHYELMQAARRLADRAAAMRLVAVCEDVLGEARDEVPLPVLAAARRAADRRQADAMAALRRGVGRELGRGRQAREVAREAAITPATLYSWYPASTVA